MRHLIALCCATLTVAAVLDRVELVVGRRVITELQLEEEMKVTSFLNVGNNSESAPDRRAAAHRLLEQALIAREMELARFPPPEESAVNAALGRIRAQYSSNGAFTTALSVHGINEQVLEQHIARQISMLRFIEYRFHPQLAFSDSDLQTAYREYVADWNASHPKMTPPSFDEIQSAIRARVLERRTDAALDDWIRETRRQVNVVYLDRTLEPPSTGSASESTK
ncbi:MAG: hypothetical protein JO061_05455 [Acidobacteriaceae bacterium]|nr:hypothetical protein [Acidobacteriaceae bacterium]